MDSQQRRLEIAIKAIRERIKMLSDGNEALRLAQLMLTYKRTLYALRGHS
jgi:hypothetical protein